MTRPTPSTLARAHSGKAPLSSLEKQIMAVKYAALNLETSRGMRESLRAAAATLTALRDAPQTDEQGNLEVES